MSLNHGFDRISSCPNCRVKAADLFDTGLSEGAIEELGSLTQRRTRLPGDVLFEEGHAPRGVFLIDAGRVKLSRRADARPQVVKIARSGDVLGLGATLTNRPHHVTGEVIAETSARFLPLQEFHRFLQRHGMYLGRLVVYLEQHVHHEQVPFAVSSAAKRVATFLLETAYREGRETTEGVCVELPVTLRELSSLLVVRPERLEDVFDRFEEYHWLYRGWRSVTLLDESALTAISRASGSN